MISWHSILYLPYQDLSLISRTCLSCLIVAWLMYAIGSKDIVLNNKVVKYLSGIRRRFISVT